ncbi:methionyl-tRNA formyltransferase [Desulfotomaculum copahuensis]|uniref:Methionyl-tRNA formyltransferase n=1 Tax=Desulfotomaculum copahuensis TaxID=1838280 RepID=A0A1B7LE84_9FIRM|nr:methionyl-tRNA formyltransferase [Desulfotomaculum copahuensis]OAT81418.1 methionyl-tRNA formyltransferase [Desulfotomaculum copahuensis]
MRVVFMGTPDFAVPALQSLIRAGYRVVAVVTQPDRPRGRGKKLLPGPVKQAAREHGLTVLQPERIKEASFLAQLARLEPDVVVVAAYGQILSPAVLNLPRLGCLNIHASLLPRYRGAAPVHRAVMNGERETGVSIMLMNEGLDTGAVLLQKAVPVTGTDTTGLVQDRLAGLGAELLLETLPRWAAGKITPRPQDDAQATYAPPLTRQDEIIDWQRPARAIADQVRGLDPRPGARTCLDGRLIKIWRALPRDAASAVADAVAGQVLTANREELLVLTGQGCLEILELQAQGGRRLPASVFLRGRPLSAGTVLGGEC